MSGSPCFVEPPLELRICGTECIMHTCAMGATTASETLHSNYVAVSCKLVPYLCASLNATPRVSDRYLCLLPIAPLFFSPLRLSPALYILLLLPTRDSKGQRPEKRPSSRQRSCEFMNKRPILSLSNCTESNFPPWEAHESHKRFQRAVVFAALLCAWNHGMHSCAFLTRLHEYIVRSTFW